MTETIDVRTDLKWNPFAATLEVFEDEGTCRVVGSWKVERSRYDEMDWDERILPDNIDLGYCLVGGIRAAFNRHYGTPKSLLGDPGDDSWVPRGTPNAEREYFDTLVFAYRHLPEDDLRELTPRYNHLSTDGAIAESALIDWNDRIVGNHQDPAKDDRVFSFVRSLIPLWEARETVNAR